MERTHSELPEIGFLGSIRNHQMRMDLQCFLAKFLIYWMLIFQSFQLAQL